MSGKDSVIQKMMKSKKRTSSASRQISAVVLGRDGVGKSGEILRQFDKVIAHQLLLLDKPVSKFDIIILLACQTNAFSFVGDVYINLQFIHNAFNKQLKQDVHASLRNNLHTLKQLLMVKTIDFECLSIFG